MIRNRKIFFTVTNDLSFDQRMVRICTSLSLEGYAVTLIGRKLSQSLPLASRPFVQHRIRCFFNRGFMFYAEYNIRLLFFLLTRRMDCICAIDLDTILPCMLVSMLKRIPRVYDAHELFCEMKEVITRRTVHRIWKVIERFSVPKFIYAYTVNTPIAAQFKNNYGRDFSVIRNLPVLRPLVIPHQKNKFIIYQGAVNEGRSFETLIPAMKDVATPLKIFGDGNFLDQAKALVSKNQLYDRIAFEGSKAPEELTQYSVSAWIGITLFENVGLSNYLSLGNRFFDYIHAGLPQICVNYPAYKELNDVFEVALLIDDCTPGSIARGLNQLLSDQEAYNRLQQNCLRAREELCWQKEEKILFDFYEAVFASR